MRRSRHSTHARHSERRSKLQFESLEDRRVLATLTVTDAGDSGEAGTLRLAISAANSGDTIVFDDSLSGTTIELLNGELAILRPLTIDASTLANPITIDASGNDPTPDVDDGAGSRAFHIDPDIQSEMPVVFLRGLRLTGGDVDGSGGAISSYRFIQLDQMTIENNYATLDGGGIYVEADEENHSAIQLMSSDIASNRAGRNGGGIATNLAFFDYVDEIKVVDNVAAGNGGGIYHAGWLSLVNEAQISGNTAVNGGGIFLASSAMAGTFILRRSTISSNSAQQVGGGIAADDLLLRLDTSTVSSNEAGTQGGGLWIKNDQLGMDDSTVVSNVSNTALTVSEPTGAGIYVIKDGTGGGAFVASSVIANNMRRIASDESVADDLVGDTFASQSLIESSSDLSALAGRGNVLGVDPELEELADNGGFGLTHLPKHTSLLIDNGGPPPDEINGGSVTVELDQRALPRYVDGDADGFSSMDIGAVERQDANQRPAVDAGEDVTTRTEVAVQLNASVTAEPANAPITLLWEVVSGPTGASFDDATITTPIFTPGAAGTYELSLTATDGSGSASDTLIIEVTDNQVPFAKVSVSSLKSSTRFPLEVNGQLSLDPEMDALDYLWSVVSAPAGSQFDFDDNIASIAHLTTDTPGDYLVQLVVDDGFESSLPFEFTVTFENTMQAGGPYALIAENDLQLYGPTRFVSAPDGIGQITWDLDNDGFYFDAQGNAPLITWEAIESILVPNTSGVFPISAENFIGAGHFTYHDSMLTILPPGAPQMSGDRGADGLTGDIDGDGDIDAVGRLGDLGQLIAFFNDGSGNFTEQTVANEESLFFVQASALSDVDQDGDLDLIITPRVKPTTLMLNDGTGQFASVSEFATANSKFGQVDVADVNGDGFPDVLVADTDGVQLYLNDGSGNLVHEQALFVSHPVQDVELGEIRDLVFADFDGDGLVDVMIERLDTSKDLWFGQGGAEFELSATDISNLPSLMALTNPPTDLDSDGDADWVGKNGRIYRQDASGRFFDVDFVRPALEVRAVADINRDGHVDVVADFDNPAAFTDNNELEVYLNDGLGTFSDSFPLGITLDLNNDSSFLLEDFNGDGQLDLLKPGASSSNTEIWFNQIVPASWHNFEFAADVNNSGEVSPLDPLLVINELNDREYSTSNEGILAIAPGVVPVFIDVNDDNLVSPADAILAINALTDENGGPLLGVLPNVTMKAGSPLAVALDGNVLSGASISYSATTDRPGVMSVSIPEGNRSLRISVSSPANNISGQMTFQLFENYVPRVTNQIIQLAQSGFYDGLTFHRILDNFVIQGGDPNGDGTGESDLPDFDDQYHPHLQHNQTGILSMAKSFDDTNNSQFFITEGASRHLDFNHSIFGFMVEGETTRQAVSNVPATPAGQPNDPVVMDDVDVIIDNENRVLLIQAVEGFSGTANVSVTATVNGKSVVRTFQMTVLDDNFNSTPYLEDIPVISTAIATEVTYQLVGVDVENNDIVYFGPAELVPLAEGFPVQLPPSDVIVSVDASSGLLRITPTNGYAGTFEMTVGVSPFSFRADDFQTMTVVVG